MDQTRRHFMSVAAAAAAAGALRPGSASGEAPVPAGKAAPAGAEGTRASFPVRSGDGTVLAAEAKGDPGAPEILFIHGLRQSRLSWDKQFADPALAGLRLVRFDLRGHGDSDKPAELEAYSDADRWADDVAAVIAAARLRRPVLVGWSLGGYVAGAYLRRHGGSGIAGLNLVDAVSRLSLDLLTPLAGDFTGSATSHDLATRVTATAEFLAACFHRPPTGIAFQRMLVVNGMTARAANEGFVKTSTTDLEPVFAAYGGPILLTHGAHDRLVRRAMAERIRSLKPGARLSVFADSGHSPFYEEPARFGRELAAFVAAAHKA
ncbi:AB hydrolase superfamily protein YdjP [Methylobacterium crusticola]|uniref:AB hydrolase superfamily protein YdjP n=1 Tax=Methylobacterium crusticola TaxID=1697972 RepID=A0ABQ4QX12_9HYPH|nr:alpha/beta hydrolase [Methylobacterium crusticola]GJD49754.1 AB hydrolase superfamily protein YdjP [Methylobacterium crusticola]